MRVPLCTSCREYYKNFHLEVRHMGCYLSRLRYGLE